MYLLILFALALIPGILLLFFILYMDRNEKEPLGLVMKMVLAGAVAVIPAVIIELALDSVPIFARKDIWGIALAAFLQISLTEETMKLLPVLIFIWKNPNFNEQNDGIVYMGASALGFAMLENVLYVFQHGTTVGVMRAVTAMPLHCFTGVIMGYYLGKAKMADKTKTIANIAMGFILAVLIHGFYDTLALSGTSAAILIVPIIILLVLFGLKLMKQARALSVAQWSEKNASQIFEPQSKPFAKPSLNMSSPSLKLSSQELFNLSQDQPQLGTEKKGKVNLNNEQKTKQAKSKKIWKVILSRMIFVAAALFWFLLILGASENIHSHDFMTSIAGGLVLSIVPLLLAFSLEISYYREQ